MKCIYCFLKDDFQYEIKVQHRNMKFEQDLVEYKKNFIGALNNTCQCSECTENHNFNESACKFLDELSSDLKTKSNYIVKLFEEITNVYLEYISKNHSSAYNKLVNFLTTYSTNYTSINAMQLCKPMFRVRQKGNDYDKNNINQYIHIPFSKRFLAGNQRYSIAGIPMSYMAESLQIALDEVGKNIDEVNIALFFPRFSCFYREGMYDVSNGLSKNIDAIITSTYQECNIEYNNRDYTIKKSSMNKILADYILYQVLQFPTNEDTKGVFVQEYVLPQLMMEITQNKGDWKGMQFQTSKFRKYSNERVLRNVPCLNYCFFIPYVENNDYNEIFLSKFFYAIYDENDEDVTLEELKQKISDGYQHCREAQAESYVMDEYFGYIRQVESYIECMLCINGEKYKEDSLFRVEKILFYKYLNNIDEIICNPEKYNFNRR